MDRRLVGLFFSRVVPLFLGGMLGGCAGLTQMQNSLTQLDSSAHQIATGQKNFWAAAHSLECESAFYRDVGTPFVLSQRMSLDLRPHCSAKDVSLNSAQLERRSALLDAVTLYTDKLQAIGSSDSNKSLEDGAKDAATKLNDLAGKQGLSSANLGIAKDVEASVLAVTNMVLDKKKFDTIKSAAQEQQPHLDLLVSTLKLENIAVATTVDANIGEIRTHLQTALFAIRDKQGAAVLIDLLSVKDYLGSLSPLGTAPKVDDSVRNQDPNSNPSLAVKQLNAALDSLAAANRALATAGAGGVQAAVSDLVARAQAIKAFKGSL